jgi:hypothetical protein
MKMKFGKVIMKLLQDLKQAIVIVTVEVKANPKKTANVKSKAMHARDHRKKEEEKQKKKHAAKLKIQQARAIGSEEATQTTTR